jgi:flagellar FliL protein
MAEEEETEKQASSGSGSSIMKLALFAAVGIGIMIGGQLGTLIIAKSVLPDLIYPEWMMALAPEPVEPEEEVAPPAPPVYTKLNPPIIVSYQNGESVRFLQVSLEAMARDELSIEAFDLHSPQIRNNLLMLFASESLDSMADVDGKERMRRQSLVEVNEILQAEVPDAEIEDVFFTSFVVQ